MSSLLLGIPQKLFDAAASGTGNSLSYSLPARASQLTWQTSFGSNPASITLQLQTSLDGTIWNTIDSSTTVTGEIRTINSSAIFVRARINAISGGTLITVSVVGKQVTIGSSLLSTLSDVSISGPTDGQVLTFDGGSSLWKNADSSGGGGISFADLATPPADTALGSSGAPFSTINAALFQWDGSILGVGTIPTGGDSQNNWPGATTLFATNHQDFTEIAAIATSDGYAGAGSSYYFIAKAGDVDFNNMAATSGHAIYLGSTWFQREDTTVANSGDLGINGVAPGFGYTFMANGAADVGIGNVASDFNAIPTPITTANLKIDGATGNGIFKGTVTATDFVPTDNYKSVDGSAGLSTTITTTTLVGKTITIKNGIITGFA